ncbi:MULTISPECIES: hypothetical protein [Edwardsiella]|uniref:Uncharacterized protein n=2 Tax=Edwardsiella anguillarum TaxID=1821960 RepID=A0A076LVS4_9GAMM|nr:MULTISPECIES: hypothetical protein [Edwardsiella]AIJ10573.1 Hypothetical protein ETEE_4168 [Edwardsiella anguillarum ET080813]AKR78039.1 hypothetical protein AAZ33_10670 [Edwardsiella sp. LADL05-105]KAB0587649.1 hypothetical protein F7P84_17610 [Edwardsiella anguillarum]WHP82406.1 hypothetical protein MQ095_11370 [Edwardsiella anguillarum]WHP86205.1 hypothetical protein MQ088_11375 [Edwardsiella anguillarum]
MVTEARGRRNRVGGRDFYERSVYIGRYWVNITLSAPQSDLRPLVPAQRMRLNQLVQQITDCGYDMGMTVWQKVYAELGVNGVDELTVSHYPAARGYLQILLKRARDKSADKALIRLLQMRATTPIRRRQLQRYCHIQFGSSYLHELNRSQLRQALAWLEEEAGDDIPALASPFRQRYRASLLCSVLFIVGVLLGLWW